VLCRKFQNNNDDHLHTELVQTKFSMGNFCRDNHHQSIDRYVRSGLGDPISRLSRILSATVSNFFNDTPSVATLSTRNNPQDLDPEYLEDIFPVQ